MNNHERGMDTPAWVAAQRSLAASWYHEGSTSLTGVWTYFFGLGGDADEVAIDAYLHELGELPPSQMNLLALAIWELDMEGTTGT